MPKPNGKHGHEEKKHRRGSKPDTSSTLAPQDLGFSETNMATGVSDSKPHVSSAAPATDSYPELHADAASDRVHKEPAQAPSGQTTAEQPQRPQWLGELATVGATSSLAAERANSPTAVSATTSKRSGKRRKGQKRRERMPLGSKGDDSAREPLSGASSKSPADTGVQEFAGATSVTPSGALKEISCEGTTDKQLEKAPAGVFSDPSAGTTDEGQDHMQQVSSQPLPPEKAPDELSAPRVDLPAVITSQRAETDAGERGRFDRNYRQRPEPARSQKPSVADIMTSIAKLDTVGRSPDPSTCRQPKRFRTDISIAAVCVGTVLLFSTLVIFLVIITKNPVLSPHFCQTVDCDRHATLLTQHLNWSLNPCEDYEKFVCSAWEPSKAHRDLARSAMDDLRFTWYDLFMDTLARGSLTLPAGKKPLAMYKMCTRNYPKNASQMMLIRGMLEQYGVHWPETPEKDMSPLTMFVALSYKWQWSFWITVNVLRPSSSGKRRVFVSPGLYLPILRNHHHVVAQAYIKYWEQFLFLFYPNGSADRPPLNETHVNEIRIMEGNIIDTLYQLSISSKKRPALLPFGDIASHAPGASPREWVENFQTGLSLEPGLDAKDEIIVSDVSLLETLASILAQYGTKQLNEHISWLMVQYFSIPADYSILVRYYGSQQKAELLLPVYCAHHVEASFKVLLLGLGFFARFTERDRQTITTGFNGLVSASVERIQNADWMDDQSKAEAKEKLNSIKNAFWPPASLLEDGVLERIYAGFPDNESSYAHYWIKTREAASEIRRTQEYDEAMLLLGNNFPDYAGYDYISNAAKLSIGVAEPPAYYSSGNQAMLYGGLLFLMAMQLVKALDSEGIRWTTKGTVADGTILSNSTLEAYLAREQCPHGEGSTSIFPEVPAMEVAHYALTKSQLHLDGGNLALSSKLPEEHVFFMTLCFMTCAGPGARNPGAADCNKVMRNSELFARAYKCPKGSNMNPEKKCSFFT